MNGQKLRVLDLFSGIGGFSLGLERTGGFQTVAFCEIEDYPRRVLAQHWPSVPCYDDVRTLTADTLARDGIAVDVICGGFPCQDVSFAGAGHGLAGERSGLWREYARIVREVRPRFVIVENVSALLSRGLGDVLADLAALGFDAEWHCIPASSVGAPHRRDRVWIVAHSAQQPERKQTDKAHAVTACGQAWDELGDGGQHVANASKPRFPASKSHTLFAARRWEKGRAIAECSWWASEPDVGRVAHGVPSRVDRLGALGNAVVPQIPELIGRAILKAEGLT